jgi:hypothetical protein
MDLRGFTGSTMIAAINPDVSTPLAGQEKRKHAHVLAIGSFRSPQWQSRSTDGRTAWGISMRTSKRLRRSYALE